MGTHEWDGPAAFSQQVLTDAPRRHGALLATRTCPKCHEARVYRSRRRGLWEWLLRMGHIYPFRCDICAHRFKRLALRGR
jgi:hypothetical protein